VICSVFCSTDVKKFSLHLFLDKPYIVSFNDNDNDNNNNNNNNNTEST